MDESLTLRQPLPDRWIAKIFQELQGNYGSRFLNQWKTGQQLPDGSDVGIRNAMAMWAKKLGGFIDMPEAIKSVLDNLPSEPPSLPVFHDLCREAGRRNIPVNPAIAYTPTPEEQAKANSMIQAAAERMTGNNHDHRAWIKALERRADGGEKLSLLQITMMNEARRAA